MIQLVKGNLLESNCDYICHQVNCMGRMRSGIAKQIREKWPVVYQNYMAKCNFDYKDYLRPELLLGDIQIVGLWEDFEKETNHQSVINMFSQYNYGYDGKRYTSYDAFWGCLGLIKEAIPKGRKIGFPYGIGCGLGGANWEVIYTMIKEVLGKDYDVYIYIYEEK